MAGEHLCLGHPDGLFATHRVRNDVDEPLVLCYDGQVAVVFVLDGEIDLAL